MRCRDLPGRPLCGLVAVFVVALGVGCGAPVARCGECIEAPASTCVGGSVRSFTAPGACVDGACLYESTETVCASGCGDGRCVACVPACEGKTCGDDGCGGRCGPAVCATPPAARCQGEVLLSFASIGSCEAGACAYVDTETACAHGCANAACRSCAPDCTNRECGDDGCGGTCGSGTCAAPPASECASATMRRSYSNAGTCFEGSCTYAVSDLACPAPTNGTARCLLGSCDFSCGAGFTSSGGSCVVSGLQPGAPWPMRGGDPTHQGRSAVVGAQTATVKWAYTTGGDISVHAAPSIAADGTVYVVSQDQRLNAVNPDGSRRWVMGTQIKGTPAIAADGTLYVGSQAGLKAMNADGSAKWTFATGDAVLSGPVIGPDGTVYVGSDDFKLYAVNPDGTRKWAFVAANFIASSPALGADATVYFGSNTSLYAVKADGTLRWRFETENFVRSSPAIGADGLVYVGSYDGKLYAVKPDGTLHWAYNARSPIQSSPALGLDGTVYFGAGNRLHAVRSDGTLRWSFETANKVESSPALGADGTAYVGSWDGKVYAVKRDGSLRWAHATGDLVSSSAAIGADGTVYIGSTDRKLYAFGP